MTDTPTSSPDEHAVRAALGSARFQSGVDGGRWRLISFEWPIGVFGVSAAPRECSPAEYGLRINFDGYPQQAPTAEPWNLKRNERLAADERPKGERAGPAFRSDWNEGRALYVPWDRTPLADHADWVTKHKSSAWHPGRDVAFFLRSVYDLLNDDDYVGV